MEEKKCLYTTYVARRLVSARREKALRTDGPTNGRTDTPSYKVAYSQLKSARNVFSLELTLNSGNIGQTDLSSFHELRIKFHMNKLFVYTS